jgi:hypothetical protein
MAVVEGNGKRGRPWKRWTDQIKEGLKKVGIRSWNGVTRDRKERRMIVLEGKVITDCSAREE